MDNRSRRTRPFAMLLALGGCALVGGDDGKPATDGATCVQASDCGPTEICNLVTQRCAPRDAAAANQIRAEFVCPLQDDNDGGPAYYSWNHQGQKEDFGALCFGKKLGDDYVTLFMFGGESAYAVSVELDPTKGAGEYPTPTESLAYVDSRGEGASSFGYGVSGSVTIDEVDANEIRGSMVVGLDRAYAIGESCETASARCGSAGVGVFCNRQDPTGVATCRSSCFGARTCDAEEACVTNDDGFDLCVPATGLLNGPCEVQADCQEGLCLLGQLGAEDQRFCRKSCSPAGRDWCGSGPEICAELMGGGGACIPHPCSLGTCETGACQPAGLFEAICVEATQISGSFDVQLTASGATLEGSATLSGMVLGGTAISATGVAGAVLGTDGTTVEILLGATEDRVLVIQVPVPKAVPLAEGEEVRLYVPVWEFGSGVIDVSDSEPATLAVVASGSAGFASIGRRVGDRITGAFDLWYARPTQ